MDISSVRESLDDIFGSVIVGGMDVNAPWAKDKGQLYNRCLPRFRALFPQNIFENEYALFYTLIVDARFTVFYEADIVAAIDRNKDMILNSPYIDIDSFIFGQVDSQVESQSNEVKLYAFQKAVIELFNELSKRPVDVDTGVERFEAACRKYTEEYISQLQEDIPHKMARIMSDEGYRVKLPGVRSRLYKGYDDACEYFRAKDSLIRDLKATSKKATSVIDATWLEEQMEEELEGDKQSTIGTGIEEIDNVIGTIRRSNMVGILGPPKGGKTRFTTYLVTRYLEAGYNVVVWPLEGTEEEWNANIVANLVYNDSGIYVSGKAILEHKSVPEAQQAILLAKTKLAVGKGRGRLSFINQTAYAEDFIEVLRAHYEQDNKYDVIVIDSPVHILSRKGVPKADRISSAYEELKVYISKGMEKEFVAILPAQLKQSVVDQLRKNKDDTIDVTAGGESAATVRSPDYIWGLFSSKEERANDMMKIYDVASRHNVNFGDFYAGCKLGCCHFWSVPEYNNQFNG